jgi:peptide/nickel transport system substrate-binding protein
LQKIVQEELPAVHLVNEIALMAVRDRIKGFNYNGLQAEDCETYRISK